MEYTNNNELLLQSILKLPQVLQVYISMYNVEHRKMMKYVLDEFKHNKLMKDICKTILFYYKEIKCHNCHCMLRRIDQETVSTGGYYECYYCCIDCFYDDRWV